LEKIAKTVKQNFVDDSFCTMNNKDVQAEAAEDDDNVKCSYDESE